MPNSSHSNVLSVLRRAVDASRISAHTDAELLQQFTDVSDESAFEELLRRHGPMVFDVCSSLLPNPADAEDAFQASFLLLANKASTIRKATSLAAWLHGVAYRVSRRAQTEFARRRKHEQRIGPDTSADHPDEVTWREVRQIVHEELNGLPNQYRQVLTLCYLQGKRQAVVAEELALPQGTLKGRLERARALLRQRLLRRGLGPIGLLVAILDPAISATASPSCLATTKTAAAALTAGKDLAGLVSVGVVGLLRGASGALVLGKTMLWLTVVGIVLAVGFGFANMPPPSEAPPASPKKVEAPAKTQPTTKQPWREAIVTIPKQRGPVSAVAVAPDSRTVAVASLRTDLGNKPAGEIRLYNVTTGKERARINGFHPIAFSPDGKFLAHAADAGTLRLWSVIRQRQTRALKIPAGTILSLAFAPDAKHIAVSSGNPANPLTPGKVRVWRLADAQARGTIDHPGGVFALRFPSANRLVSASSGLQTVVKTWNVDTARVTATFQDPNGRYLNAALSPDGKTIATADDVRGDTSEMDVNVWSIADGERLFAPRHHFHQVQALAFSPDGKTLASGNGHTISEDRWIGVTRLWDATTGERRAVLRAHQHEVRCLAFAPDGRTLICGAWDGTVKLWHLDRPAGTRPRTRVQAFIEFLDCNGIELMPTTDPARWKVVEPLGTPVNVVELHGFSPLATQTRMRTWLDHTSLVGEVNGPARLVVSKSSAQINRTKGEGSLLDLFRRYKSPSDIATIDNHAAEELRALLAHLKAKGVDLRPTENTSSYIQLQFSVGPDHAKKLLVGLNYTPPLTTEQAKNKYQLEYAIPSEHHRSWALLRVGGPRGNATEVYNPVWEMVKTAFETYAGVPRRGR